VTTYISLEEAPEPLRKNVEEVLNAYREQKAELLAVSRFESTPFKNKSIVNTRYSAYVQIANYFMILSFDVCTNPDWSSREVRESGMIAADIIEFVKRSEFLQYGVRQALREEGWDAHGDF